MSVGRQPGKPGWLATVVNLTGGTARRLVPAERRDRAWTETPLCSPGGSIFVGGRLRAVDASSCCHYRQQTLAGQSVAEPDAVLYSSRSPCVLVHSLSTIEGWSPADVQTTSQRVLHTHSCLSS